MGDLCDLPATQWTTACQIKNAADSAGQVIEFAKDPLGYIAQSMQQAAAGLADTVLPELEKLTHPDLSLTWFLDAYKVSFALAIFVFVFFLGWNFIQQARRRISGDEVMETLAFYTPMFFGGVILGPMLGSLLLKLTGALTDSLIGWGVSGSVGGTTKALQAAIAAGEGEKIAGGTVVAIIVFFCMIIALLLTFMVLLVMLVTLYLTGALIPLSLVWLVHPRQRRKGMQLVMVWIGICFSHVLLFLLLGVAFRMVGGLATGFEKPGLTILANLAVAVIALLTATLSPFGLLKFAPVGPSAGGSGPSLSLPSSSRSGGGSGFARSGSDSQAAQLARSNESDAGDGGQVGGGELDGAGAAGQGSSGSSAGGLTGRLDASNGGSDGGTSSSVMEPASTASAEADTVEGGSTGASGVESTGTAAPGTDTSSTGPDAQRTATAGGADLLGSAGKGTDSAAAAGTAAAGTAAESTGIGAPIGVALQVAGAALQAAGSTVSSTAQLAHSAGQMASEHMDHGDNYEGGSSADSRPGR